ncbi:MAG: SDR family NAD(P)-dependent oxidoreductase [Chloroflexota bacterium]|nr:SDR family NAD(P)-dependent oxidoreductase [Chloroflexota bacterium]
MQIEFSGKTVIVTGAAHGFGRAMCRAFAQRGAHVWGCDVLTDELAETQRLCREAGGVCDVRTVDVRDLAAIHQFTAAVDGADILINNAGGVLGYVGNPVEAVTPTEWNDILAVNLSAAFWFVQGVVPTMKARGFGRIINISSGAGLNISLTGIQAYATAKAGVIHLTRQLAHELGQYGITVNSIAPGFVRSNANTERQWQSYGDAGQQKLIDGIAMRRLGTSDDITHGALFLASAYAGWITGQVLPIDGGK